MAETNTGVTTGGCLCGAVRFQVSGPLRDVVKCHRSMCQKLHGVFGAHYRTPVHGPTVSQPIKPLFLFSADLVKEERALPWFGASVLGGVDPVAVLADLGVGGPQYQDSTPVIEPDIGRVL